MRTIFAAYGFLALSAGVLGVIGYYIIFAIRYNARTDAIRLRY